MGNELTNAWQNSFDAAEHALDTAARARTLEPPTIARYRSRLHAERRWFGRIAGAARQSPAFSSR